MANQLSILARRIPWTEEPGGPRATGGLIGIETPMESRRDCLDSRGKCRRGAEETDEEKQRKQGGRYRLPFFYFSFEVIVDSQTVIRNHTETFHMLLSVLPNGNTLHNYSILFFFFFLTEGSE